MNTTTQRTLISTIIFFALLGGNNYAVAAKKVASESKTQSLELQKRKFQLAYKKVSNRRLPLAAVSISKDCQAETTCPNGTVLECSIQGPSTSCHSDAGGVGCFKSNDDGSVTGSSGTC